MITREDIYGKTVKIIRDNVPDMFGTDLNEDTVLNAEGNVDSMGFILVVTKLEGEFSVRIPDREWDKIRTLGDLVDTVYRHLPKGNE
ncbi:MAG: acyl carrier protein [Solobacterium sp.]|nr:acyl carrier protein [Solobacterium sp.]